MGCPAPVVYRKCAGGGLLREPHRVDSILGALRDAVKIRFTVKTRLGFDSTDVFSELLPIFAKHSLDLLRSEEHTSELQSHLNIVCRLLLEKKNTTYMTTYTPH